MEKSTTITLPMQDLLNSNKLNVVVTWSHAPTKSKERAFQKQLDIAIKALEFYASQDSWQHGAPVVRSYAVVDKSDLGIGDFELDEFTGDDDERTDDKDVGGLTARVALRKIKEMEK